MQNEESKAIIANHWQSVENVVAKYLSMPNHGLLIAPAILRHRLLDPPSYLQLQTSLVDVEIRNLFNGENNLFHFALPPKHHEWVSLTGPNGYTSVETKAFDFVSACVYIRTMLTTSKPTQVLWAIKYDPEKQEWSTIQKFDLQSISYAITISQWPFSA